MEELINEGKRIKQRIDVNLQASYCVKDKSSKYKNCEIYNLSASGARAHFPLTEELPRGAIVFMQITIPHTLLRISTEGKVRWSQKRLKSLAAGIMFKDMLSDTLFQQLVKKKI